MWELYFTRQAKKDARKLAAAGLKEKAEALLAIIQDNPYQTPPPYEKLVGDLSGAFSRRINIQHRLVYQVLDDQKVHKGITSLDTLRVVPERFHRIIAQFLRSAKISPNPITVRKSLKLSSTVQARTRPSSPSCL